MSAAAAILLIAPLLWVALIWSVNRLAVRRAPYRSNRVIFLSSGPHRSSNRSLGAVLGYGRAEPVSGFHDPKVWVMLLFIGLPASIVATTIAYWGSEERLLNVRNWAFPAGPLLGSSFVPANGREW